MDATKQEMVEQLRELEDGEEKARQERIKVEKLLDQMELERLEWQRLQQDMYPGIKPEIDDD
jgi:hypothetical protein